MPKTSTSIPTRTFPTDRISKNFYKVTTHFGQDGDRFEVPVVVPPNFPVLMFIGASHCRRMSEIDLNMMQNNSDTDDREKVCRGKYSLHNY